MLCELCEADEAYNFHHFIPRMMHRNKWFKKRYTRDQMQQGIRTCRGCHNAIHEFIPEKLLGRNYNTVDSLRSQPDLARFIGWKRRRLTRHEHKTSAATLQA